MCLVCSAVDVSSIYLSSGRVRPNFVTWGKSPYDKRRKERTAGIAYTEDEKEIIWAEGFRVNFSGWIQSTGEEDNLLS